MPTHRITFVDEDVTIEVDEDRPILEQAEEAGVDLPYQCRMGVCGVCCALRMAQGKVDQTEAMFLTLGEQDEGFTLLCIGHALSDLRLQSNTGP